MLSKEGPKGVTKYLEQEEKLEKETSLEYNNLKYREPHDQFQKWVNKLTGC